MIEELFLTDSFRNQGIGPELMQTLLDLYPQVSELHLVTDRDARRGSPETRYRSLGFETTPSKDRIVQHEIHESKLYMSTTRERFDRIRFAYMTSHPQSSSRDGITHHQTLEPHHPSHLTAHSKGLNDILTELHSYHDLPTHLITQPPTLVSSILTHATNLITYTTRGTNEDTHHETTLPAPTMTESLMESARILISMRNDTRGEDGEVGTESTVSEHRDETEHETSVPISAPGTYDSRCKEHGCLQQVNHIGLHDGQIRAARTRPPPPTRTIYNNVVDEHSTWSTHGMKSNPAQGFIATSTHDEHTYIHCLYVGQAHRTIEGGPTRATATALIHELLALTPDSISYQLNIRMRAPQDAIALKMFTSWGFRKTTQTSQRIHKHRLSRGLVHLRADSSCLEHRLMRSQAIYHHDTACHTITRTTPNHYDLDSIYFPATVKKIIHEADQHQKEPGLGNLRDIRSTLRDSKLILTSYNTDFTQVRCDVDLPIHKEYIQRPPLLNRDTLPIAHCREMPTLETEITKLYNHGGNIFNYRSEGYFGGRAREVVAQVRGMNDEDLARRTRRVTRMEDTADDDEKKKRDKESTPSRRRTDTYRWHSDTLVRYLNRHRRYDDDVT